MPGPTEGGGDPTGTPHYDIFVDGQPFTVTQVSMTGAQIKALVGKDAQYQLFLEKAGDDPDQLIDDQGSVAMSNGLQFYTVPSASFGNQSQRWI